MAIIKSYDLDALENVNEKKVWNYIENYVNDHPKVCRCRDCILDIAAIALNSLKPAYNVSVIHANQKPTGANIEEIKKAVKKAVKIVTKSPHHI